MGLHDRYFNYLQYHYQKKLALYAWLSLILPTHGCKYPCEKIEKNFSYLKISQGGLEIEKYYKPNVNLKPIPVTASHDHKEQYNGSSDYEHGDLPKEGNGGDELIEEDT